MENKNVAKYILMILVLAAVADASADELAKIAAAIRARSGVGDDVLATG